MWIYKENMIYDEDDDSGRTIAHCRDDEEGRQICQCINSHDGLVEACEKAEQLMESMMVPMGIKKEGTRPNNVLKLIQQALEAAK